MIPSAFEYVAPTSIAEAADLLNKHGEDAKLLAGGHSLIPLMKLRLAQPRILIDLKNVNGMNSIEEDNDTLVIGGMSTYYQLQSSDLIKNKLSMLSDAAGDVADPQVRNLGTIGGSLSHADPAADLPAVVIALNATIVVDSSTGQRVIKAEDFFLDLLTTELRANEVLREVRIPNPATNSGTAYLKFANKASHYAVVGVAVRITINNAGICEDASVGITGAGTHAVRALETERALLGSKIDDVCIESASQKAVASVDDFLGDVHASAEYREQLLQVFVKRAIHLAVSSAS